MCDLWTEHAGMELKCYWFSKKLFLTWFSDIYDSPNNCPTILYAVKLWLKPVAATGFLSTDPSGAIPALYSQHRAQLFSFTKLHSAGLFSERVSIKTRHSQQDKFSVLIDPMEYNPGADFMAELSDPIRLTVYLIMAPVSWVFMTTQWCSCSI